ECGAAGRRIARAYHQHGAAAVLLESLGRPCNGDERAVAQLPDAACRIASDPFAKRTVVRRARIGIGRKPFAQRKEVATGFDHGKPTVFTADGGGAADQQPALWARGGWAPTPTRTQPMTRSGVLRRQSTTSPAVHRSSGPVPNAAIRPTAPGKLVTQSATEIIHSMPCPIRRQHKPSKPSGMLIRPRIPAGMTQTDTTGIAIRFASTP